MSEDQLQRERLKLVELAQFVLNRKTTDIRSELYNYLVCGAIYHRHKGNDLDKDVIISSIKEFYELDVPVKLIDESIDKLIAKGELITVQKKGQTFYLLSEAKLIQTSSIHEQYEILRENVVKEFLIKVERMFRNLSQKNKKLISNVFIKILSSIFNQYGSICSDIITGKMKELQDIPSLPDFQKIIIREIQKIGNPKLRKIVKDSSKIIFFNLLKN